MRSAASMFRFQIRLLSICLRVRLEFTANCGNHTKPHPRMKYGTVIKRKCHFIGVLCQANSFDKNIWKEKQVLSKLSMEF